MEGAAVSAGSGDGVKAGEKGLKSNALGYLSNLVIGVASTAPGYSLAATLGFVVAIGGVGAWAPAVLVVSFVPMLLIAAAYYYMNRADPDCGTTFSWVTKAMGPWAGWLGGWAIVCADVVVMATLSYIAGIYTFLLFGLDDAAANTLDISIVAAVWIAVMTWICWRGIELSARTQFFLLAAEILALSLFAAAAFIHVFFGDSGVNPSLDWLNPFSIPGGLSAMLDGMLLGVFIYWGWDSGVCVNEESKDSSSGPGRAAIMSTIVLVLIYVIVALAAVSYAGTVFLKHNADDVLSALGTDVLGEPLDKVLIIAVLTSAAASTQTTILPTARTTLSMARFKSIPRIFGRIHPRYLTPDVSTLAMGAVSLIWTLAIINISENVLADSLTGLGFLICFYYGLTGLACTIFYRKELFKSVKNFFLVGVAPLAGFAILALIFVKAYVEYKDPVNTTSGSEFLGVGVPVAIGVGLLLVGIVLMVLDNFVFPKFFKRKWETAEPGILEGTTKGEASVMAD
ncbi:MAG: APC family permease [Actinomycetota bacterium]|nr:APC family permease [Actinomycetota bacterium]